MRIGLCTAMLMLLAVGGCGLPSFLVTPVENPTGLDEVAVKGGRGGKVAIIPVEGTISDEKSGGLLQPTENPLSEFIEQLDLAASDDSVKAVVLRVNSPGGTVTASDTMYDALQRFKQATHKPVVASAQEVMASGSYYVSCGADRIVANPTSIVGSIGVIFETVDVKGTMDKLGIQSVAIKSAELKDMGSPFKHLTDHEREVMQGMVDEYYARFKGVVVSNRHITDPQTLTLVTDGRVFSGTNAKDLGLIDQVGRLDDAIDLARQLANTPHAAVIMYKHPYGYTGSIYADTSTPAPQAKTDTTLNVKLPLTDSILPSGFYYIWQP